MVARGKGPPTRGDMHERTYAPPGPVTAPLAEGRIVDPTIPWRSGVVEALNVPAGATVGGATSQGTQLGPGSWSMSPMCTVPFVELVGGEMGSKVITWGEAVEIPQGRYAKLKNPCFHSGDIRMTAVGRNSVGARPHSITIPAVVVVGKDPPNTYTTREIDTRLARRVFLMGWQFNLTAGITYTVVQRGTRRGLQYSPATAAAGVGVLSFNKTVTGDIKYLDCGNGSGSYLDTAGKNAPDTVPHALLDSLHVVIPDNNVNGFNQSSDLFFVIEYS